MLLATATSVAVLAANPAWAQGPVRFDMPPQSAASAVQRVARQTGLQVMAPAEALAGLQTAPLHGSYTGVQALQALLAGADVEIVKTGENSVVVRRATSKAPNPAPVSADPREPAAATLEEVEVTGSRIKRAGFDTVQSAVVTSADQIERRGQDNIGAVIEKVPGFMPGVNAVGNQATFGAGQTFVNFFGLGTQRTLTLVNGRRFVSSNTVGGGAAATTSPGEQVDLGIIPTGLIDRIETVAIGGAPVYGSDAIGGTVNIILKDNFQGLKAQAQYGVADRGDAENHSYRVLAGGNFADDKGNAVVDVEYSRQAGLLESDRLDYRRLRPNPANTGPHDGISAQRVLTNFHFVGLTEGGLLLGAGPQLRFAPTGDLVPYNPGVVISAVDAIGGEGINQAAHVTLLAPQQRLMFTGLAHYEVAPRVRAFVEATYAHTSATEPTEILAPIAPSLVGTSLTFSIDNAFLSNQARNALLARGVTSTFSVARNLSDVLDARPPSTTSDLYRVVTGLEGKFDALDQTYNWDISYNYGRNETTGTQSYLSPSRLPEAMSAVAGPGGTVVCASGNSACVPINLFGQGRPSQAAIDYVIDRGMETSVNTQEVVSANFGGKLPLSFAQAGQIGFNLGAEYRRESGDFEPDATLRNGAFLLNIPFIPGYTPSSGRFSTREVYAETLVPLVAPDEGVPLIKSAELEGAVRYVDHSVTGGATTWSVGGRLAPRFGEWSDGLVLRGVFTHAIRSPAITELFSGQVPDQGAILDPCSQANYNQGPNPSVRTANCAAALSAAGAASPGTFQQTTNTISPSGFSAGNLHLRNEQADSWSVGFVFQPVKVPGLRLAVDWSDIKLAGGIQAVDINQLLQACYDTPGLSSSACSSFSRLNAAQAAAQSGAARVAGDIANGYVSGYINAASIRFSGLTATGEYHLDLDRFGQKGVVGLSGTLFYANKLDTVNLPGQPVIHSAGTISMPAYRADVDLDYRRGRLDLDLEAQWTSATVLDKTATIEQTPINNLNSYTLWNLTAHYDVTSKVRAQIAVNNLFDAQPPFPATVAQTYLRYYDLIGRRYVFTLSATF